MGKVKTTGPSVKELAREGVAAASRQLLHHRALSVATALGIGLAVTALGLSVWAWFNADALRYGAMEALHAEVALSADAQPEQVEAALMALASADVVREVQFVSADKDRAAFARLLGPELLEGLEDSAIPAQARLVIWFQPDAVDPGAFDDTVSVVRQMVGIDGVEHVGVEVDHMRSLFAALEIATTAGPLWALLSLLAAVTLVRMLVATQRSESRQERALLAAFGATPAQLRRPHLWSVAVLGLLGAVTAMVTGSFIDGRLRGLTALLKDFGVDLGIVGASWTLGCLAAGIGITLLGLLWAGDSATDP